MLSVSCLCHKYALRTDYVCKSSPKSQSEHAYRFMDPLGDTEGSSSDSGSESDGDEAVPRVGSAAAGRQHQTGVAPLDVDPEALVSGNSVLFVPEPKKDPNDQWDW